MRQILISKSEAIEELSGSRIKIKYKNRDGDLRIDSTLVSKVTIPFVAKIVSGGELDLDFKLSEELAQKGLNLLGAYWDGKVITAYFKALNGTIVLVPDGTTILNAVLVQVCTFRQVQDGLLGGGVLNMDQSGKALSLESAPKPKKSRSRKK